MMVWALLPIWDHLEKLTRRTIVSSDLMSQDKYRYRPSWHPPVLCVACVQFGSTGNDDSIASQESKATEEIIR